MIKPAYQQPIDRHAYDKTIAYFEDILKVLHPFMPFITEELWHDELFGTRAEKDCCIVARLPENGEINTQLLASVENIKQIVTQIRNVRNTKQLSPKESLDLMVKDNSKTDYLQYQAIISKLANIGNVAIVEDKVTGAAAFLVGTDEFFIPLNETIDPVAETEKLQKEKEYLLGFLKSVNGKLTNERFMANAKPEVIAIEQKKKDDAEAKLAIIEDRLKGLAG